MSVTGLNPAFCKPCLDRGHQCYAMKSLDGEPWCAACVAEIPCVHQRRLDASGGEKVAPKSVDCHKAYDTWKAKQTNEVAPTGVLQAKPKRKYTRRQPTIATSVVNAQVPPSSKYGAVIADLETKKADIERVIEILRQLE